MLFAKKFNFLNFLFLLSFNFISSGLDDVSSLQKDSSEQFDLWISFANKDQLAKQIALLKKRRRELLDKQNFEEKLYSEELFSADADLSSLENQQATADISFFNSTDETQKQNNLVQSVAQNCASASNTIEFSCTSRLNLRKALFDKLLEKKRNFDTNFCRIRSFVRNPVKKQHHDSILAMDPVTITIAGTAAANAGGAAAAGAAAAGAGAALSAGLSAAGVGISVVIASPAAPFVAAGAAVACGIYWCCSGGGGGGGKDPGNDLNKIIELIKKLLDEKDSNQRQIEKREQKQKSKQHKKDQKAQDKENKNNNSDPDKDPNNKGLGAGAAAAAANKDKKNSGPLIGEPNPKHHQNSTGYIGKPPRDLQKAVNESIAVSDKEGLRVAIQDKKLVVLHEHSPNKYHGYVVENFHELNDKVKNAFVDAGFVRSSKSGKIKK